MLNSPVWFLARVDEEEVDWAEASALFAPEAELYPRCDLEDEWAAEWFGDPGHILETRVGEAEAWAWRPAVERFRAFLTRLWA